MNSNLSYCGELVRRYDPDRFLLSMFAPAEAREGVWALFALNHEIAKTREVVSETALGQIRLKWWADAVEGVYKGGPVLEHEVVQALAEAIALYDLPFEEFETLIHAREFDLEDVLPGNLEGVLNYADFTSTPLLRLAGRIAGADVEAEPVQPVAVNYALMGILRAVPFHRAQRRCYLPENMMRAQGIEPHRFYDCAPDREALAEAVKEVCAEFVHGIRPQNRFLKAVQGGAHIYYRQLRSCGYDVFNPKMALEPPFKVINLILKGFL